MAIRFSFTGGVPVPVADSHPNQSAIGKSGAVKTSKGWRFSYVTSDSIVGTEIFERVDGAKAHLHIGEDEITGYQSGKHGGEGIVGRWLTDSAGRRHQIVSLLGADAVTTEEAAQFLEAFCPQYGDPRKDTGTDPRRVRPRSDGTSEAASGSVVTIHGQPCKCGGGLPLTDWAARTSLGGTLANQQKVMDSKTTTKAERLCHPGEQLLDSCVNNGRDMMLQLAVRSADGYMTDEWFNIGAILRIQAEMCGDDLTSGEFPLSAPVKDGIPGKGTMPRGKSPFYLKHARGGTKTGDITPRRPMSFSIAGLRRFLSTLTVEQRAELHSPARPFDPTFLPPFAGACIY